MVPGLLTLLALISTAAPRADEPAVAAAAEFERSVRPLLATRCLSCHGPERRRGGLRLDRRAEAFVGGDSGPAIVPGQPDDSELIARVTADDPTVAMPPRGERLSPEEVGRLRDWITRGAAWPERLAEGAATPEHWAFRPPTPPDLPAVRNPASVRSPIDRFVQARLDTEGLAPAPEAARATLLRRLSLDLTGLPPTPEQVAGFDQDERPDAFERQVDRLLASPHFGERWGRHWLDLARYADSDGYEKDAPRPEAYRFRDWVIAAFNADLPYDRFTARQLAGDLLPGASDADRVAAGFHRNTLTNTEGGVDPEEFRVKAVVDRVNTTGTVWLGLTVGCAQCHSHKSDPISQPEYYGLFAFFNPANEVDVPAEGGGKIRTFLEPPEPRATQVLIRGDFLRPGDAVAPHTPASLPSLRARAVRPDRLDLAGWLTDPAHPLTARVAANRVWGHLLGRPIVRTLDDFGVRGEPPSHPELLDWLAVAFRDDGWSTKALIRRIVSSHTYRQATEAEPSQLARDPGNVLLAHQARVRVEAEVVRDLALAASGLLAPRIGGPSVWPPQPAGIAELTYAGSARWQPSQGPDRYRRGLYTWLQRTAPYPMLTTFDAPDAGQCLARRDRSNTPLQALTLLNDPVFVEAAQALARRLATECPGDDPGARIDHAVRLTLNRTPDAAERTLLRSLLDSARATFESDPAAAGALLGEAPAAPAGAARAAWVAVARALLNLDEFVTRP